MFLSERSEAEETFSNTAPSNIETSFAQQKGETFGEITTPRTQERYKGTHTAPVGGRYGLLRPNTSTLQNFQRRDTQEGNTRMFKDAQCKKLETA